MMTHGAMLWGAALYNNGSYPLKNPQFGESYGPDGTPQRLQTWPPPTLEETRTKGVLPYLDPHKAQAATPEQASAELAAYEAITNDLAASGELRGAEAFMPRDSAVAVRLVDGVAVTDRPPGGTLELGGFFIAECDDVRAHEIAASTPVATHGAVEIRPLLEMPDR